MRVLLASRNFSPRQIMSMSTRRRSLSITPLAIIPTRQSSLNLHDQVIQTGPPPLISRAALLDELQELRLDETQRERLEQFLQARNEVHSLLPENFEVLELLGYGSGGCVNKVLHKPSGIVMARKTIQLTVKPSARNQIIQELRILHECNSPRIVGFYGAYHWQGEIHLCMEHMNGGSLDNIYRKVVRIPESILSVVTAAVIEGLAYLKEQHRVIHRDIKPSNMLVNLNGEIKLCDFGVSGLLINSMAESFVGSRSYMSPERLEGVHYSIASDIWSLGLSLVELATGRYPIPQLVEEEEREWMLHNRLPADDDTAELDNQNGTTYAGGVSAFDLLAYIQNDPPPSVLPEFFTPRFKSFVDACLTKEPAKRPDLRTLQKHSFIAPDGVRNNDDITKWLKSALATAKAGAK